jgi:predicted Mrr-cat superfamily restriction endonuclease
MLRTERMKTKTISNEKLLSSLLILKAIFLQFLKIRKEKMEMEMVQKLKEKVMKNKMANRNKEKMMLMMEEKVQIKQIWMLVTLKKVQSQRKMAASI